MRSIPVIGSYMSFFVFGGAFPGETIIPRLFTVHILLLPAIIVGLFTAHIAAGLRAQAHPVPRAGPHQQQRRRLPADAGLHRQGRWLLLHRLRRHRPHRGAGHDQPDLGVRPVRPLPGHRRLPARLVHGLRRRRAATAARLARVQRVRASRAASTSSPGAIVLHPGGLRRWSAPTRSSRRGSPATSASTTCSTARATPRPAPASASWRLVFYVRALHRRRQRHHRDQAAPVDQRHHQHAAARLSSSLPPLVLLGHQADLPEPAAS